MLSPPTCTISVFLRPGPNSRPVQTMVTFPLDIPPEKVLLPWVPDLRMLVDAAVQKMQNLLPSETPVRPDLPDIPRQEHRKL